jgi:hypothetical protein
MNGQAVRSPQGVGIMGCEKSGENDMPSEKRKCVAPGATHAHLIRIADQESRRRAITALGKAREPYCGFTDYRLLVTDEHLEVLRREAIPFEVLS